MVNPDLMPVAAASPHEESTLYCTGQHVLLVPPGPTVGDGPPAILVIDRANGQVKLSPPAGHWPIKQESVHAQKTIFGVLGWIPAPSQPQLMVITRRVRVGEMAGGHIVYRIEAVEMVHIVAQPMKASTRRLVGAVADIISTPHFFYCQTRDLTQTRQRLFEASETRLQLPLLSRVDERFVWNRTFLLPLSGLGGAVHRFLVPLIHGAVFIHKCVVRGHAFDWILISRRSNRRVGTRFFVRGCDDHGRVANFVETEQIVEYGDLVSSFVQTRGSMPMFWEQNPDIRYTPKARVTAQKDSVQGFVAHFKEQIPLYGDQVLINLIDQKKAQGELELFLKNLCREAGLKGVNYVAFDFHKECSKMRYDRLQILVDELKKFVESFGSFFYQSTDANSVKLQRGVFRTNCMDCLDRTNVVQSLLANENLNIVLKRMGILSPQHDIIEETGFQHVFKNSWADHADMISIQYAGTGALKTDFTRTGARTKYGLLQDGWNSIVRYVLNNFSDGIRTDALRFFTGEISTEDYLRCYEQKRLASIPGSLAYLPKVFLLVLAVFLFTLVFTKEVDLKFFILLVMAIGIMHVTGKMMLQNGTIWVNFPRTVKHLDHYQGPNRK